MASFQCGVLLAHDDFNSTKCMLSNSMTMQFSHYQQAKTT
uniref:Uncharacterized protein n=1 Tax=Arundo donax TaxID=35708 RepID=A0A0A9HRB7_ARUDO